MADPACARSGRRPAAARPRAPGARRAGAGRAAGRPARSALRPSCVSSPRAARAFARRTACPRSRCRAAARAQGRARASSSSARRPTARASTSSGGTPCLEALERLDEPLGRQVAGRHDVDHESVDPPAPERHHQHRPDADSRHPTRDAVVERPAQRAGRGERLDLGDRHLLQPMPRGGRRRRGGRRGRRRLWLTTAALGDRRRWPGRGSCPSRSCARLRSGQESLDVKSVAVNYAGSAAPNARFVRGVKRSRRQIDATLRRRQSSEQPHRKPQPFAPIPSVPGCCGSQPGRNEEPPTPGRPAALDLRGLLAHARVPPSGPRPCRSSPT